MCKQMSLTLTLFKVVLSHFNAIKRPAISNLPWSSETLQLQWPVGYDLLDAPGMLSYPSPFDSNLSVGNAK